MENRDYIDSNEELKPRDIYKEFAEYGLLGDYIQSRMKERYENDPEFKEKVVYTLVNYSETQVPYVEYLYLEKLNLIFDKFIESIAKCQTIQKP